MSSGLTIFHPQETKDRRGSLKTVWIRRGHLFPGRSIGPQDRNIFLNPLATLPMAIVHFFFPPAGPSYQSYPLTEIAILSFITKLLFSFPGET
ncbi:hypothetical protein CDL15_Pgr006818 [Punica granatum]|uniref:Uncharacterized protein n=1 Tax=Punica granatum TaxID=22663 RepID=A0A218X7L6_PUNGR|nr:hypothetical protein CDL15_Pgr006818 [Punica granatum]